MRRAQLSLSVLEAGIAATLILAVAGLFILTPAPPASDGTLARQGDDLGRILVRGTPDTPPLAVVLSSADHFEEYDETVGALAREALPAALEYRLETRHGALGAPRPPNAQFAETELLTANGSARLWVWYA
jgi:hypothetical protein